MPDHHVIIVGAGPAGLTMAIELSRLGVPFRLVEKSLKQAQYSQALVVQARTLEQFERYGIAGTAVQRGRQLKKASLISEGSIIVSFQLEKIPGRYPFVLFLPQSETETLLIEHLQELRGIIERGTELVSIAENNDGVAIQLRDVTGKLENTTARWVVGCDGTHSTVREGLGIPFAGTQVGLNFFLGDLELEGPDLLGDELRVYLHHGDVVFIGRLKENLFRVIVALHSQQDRSVDEKHLTIADFQEPIDRAGIRLRVISGAWMTPFRVSDRRAEHIIRNHVFLAGDASHIHSPVGGQGMNTGIQDVANLAWKIAAVSNGANAGLLQSYEEERGKVSEQLLQNTSRVLSAATASNLFVEKVRDAFLHMATRLPFVQKQLVGFVSETAIAYRHSSIVMDCGRSGALRAGDRMPNPEVAWKDRSMRLLDPLKKAGSLVIGFDVNNPSEVQAHLPCAEYLFLNSSELTRGKQGIISLLGDKGDLVVVSPDGYIGFRGNAEKLEQLKKYARTTMGLVSHIGNTVS